MDTARARLFASPAFVVALVLGLMISLGPLSPAEASHTTIDASPNSDTNLVGSSHTVTATSIRPRRFRQLQRRIRTELRRRPAPRHDF
jgi:hypothetical protein